MPLMVKGTLFGLLLLSAAVWDMRNREIPNLIPALLLLCGLIGFRPAASVAGLLLVGGPFLLAAVLIKRDGFAIGGGDVKLMGACGFVLGVWPGLIQTVLSLSLAVLAGLVECRLQKQPLSAVRLPSAPFFCFGGVSAYGDTAEGHGLSLTENQIAYFRHYFTEPQPSAVTFKVQSAKDTEEFLRLMFGDRKGGGSK